MIGALAVGCAAYFAANASFKSIQRRQLTLPRISRFFTIKFDAARFLVRGVIVLAVCICEAALVVRYIRDFQPVLYLHYAPWLEAAIRRVGYSAFIIILALAVLRLSRILTEVVFPHLSRDAAGGASDREMRARTLLSVLNGTIVTIIGVLALLLIFPVSPLLTSAGLAGIAIAFAAQALLRDFLAGFFILLENQFNIGDLVRIGDRAGRVENISLRTTVLRDEAGTIHIIPNGEIKTVSNISIGWSFAFVDITVPYAQEPQKVIGTLQKAGQTLLAEMNTGEIAEPPQVLGIESMNSLGTVYRVSIKALPSAQTEISRRYRLIAYHALHDAGIVVLPPTPQLV